MTVDHENIATARAMFIDARNNLADALLEECPGPHRFVQHRDRRPAWCEACGYAADGIRMKHVPAANVKDTEATRQQDEAALQAVLDRLPADSRLGLPTVAQYDQLLKRRRDHD